MKKLITLSALLIGASILLSSCHDNSCDNEEESRRIRLSSRVTLQTEPRLQELMIEQGQGLSLFVTRAGNTSEILYDNVNIIADGMGGFAAQNMYYPVIGNVDFFAVHPYSTLASLSQAHTFSVAADQRDKTAFLNSDLLHAGLANQGPTTNAVTLVFSHKLAKLDFTIENNDGLDLGNLNTVAVLNVLPTTTVNTVTGAITPASGSPVNISAYGIIGDPGARESVSNIHAIVVPQTRPAGSQLFQITIGSDVYTYSTPNAFTFREGYQYGFTLTITGGEISLESSILPWEDGGSIGGGAVPQ